MKAGTLGFIAVAAMTAALALATPANASPVGVNSSVSVATTTSPPTPQWLLDARKSFTTDGLANVLSKSNCTLVSATASTVTSDGTALYGGVAAGQTIPILTGVANCAKGSTGEIVGDGSTPLPSFSSARQQAAATSVSPAASQGGCGTITGPGSLCVNTGTYNGSSVIFTSYLYNGSGTTTGHTELSTRTPTQSCAVHSGAYANSGTATIGNGGEVFLEVPWNLDSNWVGTYWHYNGSYLVNWGNHCETF